LTERRNSGRNTLSLIVIAAGALLLLLVPLLLLGLALSQTKDFQLPGIMVILSAAGGMILVVVGAALSD
jgi:hypothetical protein